MQPSPSEGEVGGNGAAVASGARSPDSARTRAWEHPIGFSVALSPDDVQGALRDIAYRTTREEAHFRHRTQITWGPHGEAQVTIPLATDQVLRAIRERAYQITRARDVSMPVDEIDFHARAQVQWLDGGAATVVLEV